MHLLSLTSYYRVLVGSDLQLKLLPKVFKEDFLLENLATLLEVGHFAFLEDSDAKRTKHSELMSLRMSGAASAVAVEAQVVV